jgi:hypothetical protein
MSTTATATTTATSGVKYGGERDVVEAPEFIGTVGECEVRFGGGDVIGIEVGIEVGVEVGVEVGAIVGEAMTSTENVWDAVRLFNVAITVTLASPTSSAVSPSGVMVIVDDMLDPHGKETLTKFGGATCTEYVKPSAPSIEVKAALTL